MIAEVTLNSGLSHMEWSSSLGNFVRTKPSPSPKIPVNIKLLTSSSKGPSKFNRSICYPTAVTDTGCQTSMAGENLLRMLKTTKHDLLPTKVQMVGVTQHSLKIIGVLMAEIEYQGQTTKQMIYISKGTKDLYLSETALKDLKLIPKEFPHTLCANIKTDTKNCPCIPRTSAPEKPSQVPFTPTLENLPKFTAYFLDHLWFQASMLQ